MMVAIKPERIENTITLLFFIITFLSDSQNAPWLTIGAENISMDQYLQSFIYTFTKIIDKHLPLVTKRIKRTKQPEWITNNILLAINKRENAKKNKDEHIISIGEMKPQS